MLDGGPEPQAILDREQDDRGDLDREESRAETRLGAGTDSSTTATTLTRTSAMSPLWTTRSEKVWMVGSRSS
jgi:hypothetical protein